jgi:hypothetical protein
MPRLAPRPNFSLPPGHHTGYDPSSPFGGLPTDSIYGIHSDAVHRPRGRRQREALTAALHQLAEELAERRRCDPPLPPLEDDVGGEENEESVKKWDIAEAILKRRKQEEDPEFIANRALLKAHMTAWLKSNPAFAALPRATEAEAKEAARKCGDWMESEIMEMWWEHEDNGEPAVRIFGDVGWLCPPSWVCPIPHVMKCNSSDYEDLAIWDEENGVFTNKKGIEIVHDKYGVFKLYDLEDEEE